MVGKRNTRKVETEMFCYFPHRYCPDIVLDKVLRDQIFWVVPMSFHVNGFHDILFPEMTGTGNEVWKLYPVRDRIIDPAQGVFVGKGINGVYLEISGPTGVA